VGSKAARKLSRQLDRQYSTELDDATIAARKTMTIPKARFMYENAPASNETEVSCRHRRRAMLEVKMS